ncbi:hypothetical protein CBR_g21771 [Chara braunii]|uniref:Myb-like domain-containing protein n=1 Tax=Chara braunii TaxID=69332 RepID=A0A388L1K9_CHABU|nr:hypothetical protein CBR_g21771 [Chara braunii]|eukprot:GBG76112.1 hypothetical protein CBR_g21771 [Chara braunii]
MLPPSVDRLRTAAVERAWSNVRNVGGGVVEDVGGVRQVVDAPPSPMDQGERDDRRGGEDARPAVADVRVGQQGSSIGNGNRGGRVAESASDVDTSDDTARADGGGAPAKRRTRPWPLEERLDLARFMKEDDAMMTMASGRLKHARRSVRNEWVSRKMREAGWISGVGGGGTPWSRQLSIESVAPQATEMSERWKLRSRLRFEPLLEDKIVCPRPRRYAINTFVMMETVKARRRRSMMKEKDMRSDGDAGLEILDIFLCKGCLPPFIPFSPPSRSANPVVHDARFQQKNRSGGGGDFVVGGSRLDEFIGEGGGGLRSSLYD